MFSPLTKSRFKKFRSLKRAWYSFWILAVAFVLSLFSEQIANDHPLVLGYKGALYFPTLKFYSAQTFGGPYKTEANYQALHDDSTFKAGGGWMLMPLIPHNPLHAYLDEPGAPPLPPSHRHWLGTDGSARDMVARLIYGFRICMIFALALTAFSTVTGIIIGCIQGYFAGRTDIYTQRLIEIWSALPFLYIVILFGSIYGQSFGILLFVNALFEWITLSYYMRGEFYKLREQSFVLASRALGASHFRILFRQMLPNAMTPVITLLPFGIISGISSLTALDFLGFGLPPPTPSWGELIDEGLQNYQAAVGRRLGCCSAFHYAHAGHIHRGGPARCVRPKIINQAPMRKILPLLLFFIPAFFVSAADDYQQKYTALAADKSLSDAGRLHQLFDLDWDRGLHESPEFATSVGYPGLDGLWTDMSQEAIDKRKAEQQWPLSVIKVIDRSKLSKADQLNCDLFRRDLELGIEGSKFPGELLAISQLGGVQQNVAQTVDQMNKKSVQNYEDILSRLRGVPVLVDQNIALLKRGLAQGVTVPKITLRAVPNQILDNIPEDPMQSAMLRPFTDFPDTIPAADQERLRADAVKVYKEQLVPSFNKLYDFITKEYLPGARTTIGCSALPNGAAWYDYNVRTNTTTDMTPKEIHELGLSEVKRIHGEMDKVIADVKFKGNFDDFTKFLRTDPQFFYTKPEDLLAGYRDIAKRIDPELPKLFGKLPRLTYGVRAVPAYSEKSAPTAYYQGGSTKAGRPGWFFANTYNLPSRPKWEMECLTLHEAVPGHHLQISLAKEAGELPDFRKYEGYTAYIEGWGLYSESLGGEIGLYKDPYSKFGQLTFEMWRANRLVVDTGMHALGWSRKQAIDYMKANTGQDEFSATVEVDRYIVWPGQALAYKIGQLKIRELRTYAEHELGDAFDIRAFHDALLQNGALPLSVLESMMKEWVAAQKAKIPGK